VKFELIKKIAQRDATRAKKLEQKVAIYLGGYQNRAQQLSKEAEELFEKLAQSIIELNCFEELRQKEISGAASRTASLRQEIEKQRQRENQLQLRFANLRSECERVQQAVASLGNL